MRSLHVTSLCGLVATCILSAGPANAQIPIRFLDIDATQVGSDLNSVDNPFVQPKDPALAGGGIDQSLQFGDVLTGTDLDDLLVGRLGADILLGGLGQDVLVGGLEHFTPPNRDRAFGQEGNDIFIWKPGDGSDGFDGGRGVDAIVFGVAGEDADGDGVAEFAVLNDGQAGVLFVDSETGLPVVDLTNSPGFCEVLDDSNPDDADALDELDLDHLVRFALRGVRNAFEAGEQDTDNGVRVTVHLKDVEFLLCTNRDGGFIEVLDLRSTPPTEISLDEITPRRLRDRLDLIIQ